MNDFQERLQGLLNDNNLSRLQLANKICIAPSTINGYFNDNYYPEIEIAIKMSNFFNCSLDFLLGLSDEKNSKFKITQTNISEIFFKNFNSLIKENKVSIARTMRDLKMSEQNYYRWRDGQFPKTINLIAIANYFETSIDFLLRE